MTQMHSYTCPYEQIEYAVDVTVPEGDYFLCPLPDCGRPTIVHNGKLHPIDVTNIYAEPGQHRSFHAALRAEAMNVITIRQAQAVLRVHGYTQPWWPDNPPADIGVYGVCAQFAAAWDRDALRELDRENHGYTLAAIFAVNLDHGLNVLAMIANIKQTVGAVGN